ncbi:GNAT family N-acetyltransferase [Bradyrhizobium sp. STM 3562]|uniref:GNAT family N-acetyltransferase n=1 Tax=Bradyrhizobium sp. STM 3562 TaxID=578924 RepID=UPI00388EB986
MLNADGERRMTLVMRWCDSSVSPELLAQFFVRHVGPDYVSHEEILSGRAHPDRTWSTKLASVVGDEFSSALFPQSAQLPHQTRAFAGYDDSELVCVGLIRFEFIESGPYAVIEDLVVHSAKRAAKYGTQALAWVEGSICEFGIATLFCETGIGNSIAQKFFRRRGFRPVSVVLLKRLPSPL